MDILQKALGNRVKKLDQGTKQYLLGVLEDDEIDQTDIQGLIEPMLEQSGIANDDDELTKFCEEIVRIKWSLNVKKKKAKKDTKKATIEDDEPEVPKKKGSKKAVVVEDEEPEVSKKKGSKKAAISDEDEPEVPKKKGSKKAVVADGDDEPDVPKKKGSKKAVVVEDEEPEVPKKKGSKKTAVVADEDDEPEVPKKKGSKKAVVVDDEEPEVPKKKGSKKAAVADEDEEPEVPKKKGSKKAVVVDDDEEPEVPKKKGSKKAVVADEDDEPEVPKKKGSKKAVEDDDEPPVASSKKSGKKTKQAPAKNLYALANDEDGDAQDDDEPEVVPVAKSKKGKGSSAVSSNKFALPDDDDEAPPEEPKKKSGKTAAAEEPVSTVASRKADKKAARKAKNTKKAKGKGKKGSDEEVDEDDVTVEGLDDEDMVQIIRPPPYVRLRRVMAAEGKTMMVDIKCERFSLSVPGKILLKETDLTLVNGQKYGLVGRNGIGKSTLLKQIASRELDDKVRIPMNIKILFVEQEIIGDELTPLQNVLKSDEEREWLVEQEKILVEESKSEDKKLRNYTLQDIYERLLEIESDKAEARATSILVGLGFSEKEIKLRATKEYSGGWRMRIALARALFCQPDVLLLDEPTNHLDLYAAIWLENYLINYKKTLVISSHDAGFINGIINNLIHFHNQQLNYYKGDYENFLKVRKSKQRELQALHDKTEKKKAKLKKFVNDNKGGKQANAAATRKKQLEKIEDVKLDVDDPWLKFFFPEVNDKIVTPILQFQDVSFGYTPDKILFTDLSFGIHMDSRIALVGPNGVGKSTLMKLMLGQLKETKGYIARNSKVRLAFYSQHHVDQLNYDMTAIEHFRSLYNGIDETAVRTHLAKFGLAGKIPLTKIGDLSGGQKSKLIFGELAYRQPHLLFLDEPSNHLDLETIESLAEALNQYEGGLVMISHNQMLIELICREIWVCNRDGTVEVFDGTFEDYKRSVLAELGLA